MRTTLLPVLAVLTAIIGSGPAYAQWVEPPGTGWVKLQVSRHETETRFNDDGATVPYFTAEARSVTTTMRVNGVVGLARGLDTWIDIPYHHLQFDDVIRDRTSAGIGDPRLFLRIAPSLFEVNHLPFAVALRAGTKFPIGEFDVNAETIPLSEGQRDWEVLLELGKSLYPWPLYVTAWGGYRWREPNSETGLKPGNERFFYGAAGGDLHPFTWKLAIDGYFGQPTQFSGVALEAERRELVQFIPTVGWDVGPGVLEAGAQIPVHGRSLPAGVTFTVGYFYTWETGIW